jgi:hypothetical protein
MLQAGFVFQSLAANPAAPPSKLAVDGIQATHGRLIAHHRALEQVALEILGAAQIQKANPAFLIGIALFQLDSRIFITLL